jgi:hypothetical protein
MPQTIQTRRGTAALWTSTNPILAAGECGLETDTDKFKYGDGVTEWADLEYASGTTAGALALLVDSSPAVKTVTTGTDEDDSANVITLRSFRTSDGTELPKNRIVIGRVTGDPVNDDYTSLLFTNNLNWDNNTRDNTSLGASRLGMEYNYNDTVMEFNWDVLGFDGSALARTFHMVQPIVGGKGTFSANCDTEFVSLSLTGENGEGFSIDADSRIRSKGSSPGDVFWLHVENTHTTHSACGYRTKGTISGTTRGWSFALDRLQAGSANGFITDETYAGETVVMTFVQSSKNVEVNVGDFEVIATGKGVIMKSPNGNRWRLTVSNAGVVSATAL